MNVAQETLDLRRGSFSLPLSLLMSAFALVIPPGALTGLPSQAYGTLRHRPKAARSIDSKTSFTRSCPANARSATLQGKSQAHKGTRGDTNRQADRTATDRRQATERMKARIRLRIQATFQPPYRPNRSSLYDVKVNRRNARSRASRKRVLILRMIANRLDRNQTGYRETVRMNSMSGERPEQWWAGEDLNLRPHAYQVAAVKATGGARRDRTDDLMLAKHALSQLSYGPRRNRIRQDPCLLFQVSECPSGKPDEDRMDILRKEVIQPQVSAPPSGKANSHGVTGGVYK
ncbi:hypothetical protein AK812_SmicGene43486, partial [Symbiodinium microadriaticum]